MSQPVEHSPLWSSTTKAVIIGFALVLISIMVWQFQSLITILIMAGIVAYILNMPISWICRVTKWQRGLVIGLVYLLLTLLFIGGGVAIGVTLFNQITSLIETIRQIIRDGPQLFNEFVEQYVNQTYTFGPWTVEPLELNIDFNQITDQLISTGQTFLGSTAQLAGTAAASGLTFFGNLLLVFVLSIYFVIEIPSLGKTISRAFHQPGYRNDMERLLNKTHVVWHGYLRGQTTLALLMGFLMTVILSILGVNNALAIGVLTAFLDFIPFLGPILAVTLAALVALFQDSNWLGLSPMAFALLIVVIGTILQQIEGNWLSPRIVGGAVGLHPLLVMVGAIMGGSIAGILGVILAAPILATIAIFTTYVWRKMFDLPAFFEDETEPKRGEKAPPPSSNSPQARKPTAQF